MNSFHILSFTSAPPGRHSFGQHMRPKFVHSKLCKLTVGPGAKARTSMKKQTNLSSKSSKAAVPRKDKKINKS